mmetsp:Transcript_146797/g.471303  ORF Transcript_146797/g.471303 Transcript_146797/m.471303 type:complete len:204 (+) Transcript_146797:323-934(+)
MCHLGATFFPPTSAAARRCCRGGGCHNGGRGGLAERRRHSGFGAAAVGCRLWRRLRSRRGRRLEGGRHLGLGSRGLGIAGCADARAAGGVLGSAAHHHSLDHLRAGAALRSGALRGPGLRSLRSCLRPAALRPGELPGLVLRSLAAAGEAVAGGGHTLADEVPAAAHRPLRLQIHDLHLPGLTAPHARVECSCSPGERAGEGG